MSFRRTDAGISNLYLFLGVDMVVFVEGGDTSYSFDQMVEGHYNEQADDLKYWGIIFAAFAGLRKVHLRAVGSKLPLLELAELIEANKIKRVMVAMDRDFIHFTSKLRNVPGVITTIGYSWENDVWTEPVVYATFRKFNSNLSAEKEAGKLVTQEFLIFEKKVRRCVLADTILAFHNLDPLPREELKKVVRPNPKGPPTIATEAGKAIVRARRQNIRPKKVFARGVQCIVKRDCYGHLLGNFGYFLLVYILKRFSGIKLTPKELLIPAAIDAFSTILSADPELVNHYTSLFNTINWAA